MLTITTIVSYFRDGIERKVAKKVEERFQKALELLKVEELDRSRSKAFTVTGFELFHAGSKHSIFGSLVGIPINYEYERVEEVPLSEVTISGQPVQWNEKSRELCRESLVLTEDEQIFGIMREILHTQTFKIYIDCFYPIIAVALGYGLGHNLNNHFQLFTRPLSLRMMMYFIVGFFTYGTYVFSTDTTACYYDALVDKKLAELGERWIIAGNSFYEKMLKKNVAIRTLTGDNSVYTASGNINYLIRQKAMPLTTRKKYFEQKYQKLFDTPTETRNTPI